MIDRLEVYRPDFPVIGHVTKDMQAESILDGKDDPTLGIVDFEPFAVEAFDLDVPECE